LANVHVVRSNAKTIEQVVAKMRTSHLELIGLMSESFELAGAATKAYQPLLTLAAKARRRPPGWFNVAANFAHATESALAMQKRVFAKLGHRESWADVDDDAEAAARRMQRVAALCARAGETAEAVELLDLARERAPLAGEPQREVAAVAKMAGVAAEDVWRLHAAYPLLIDGVMLPWPPALARLADGQPTRTRPEVADGAARQALARALVELARPLITALPFAAGAEVWIKNGSWWKRGKVHGARDGGYAVSFAREVLHKREAEVVRVSSGGAGALLRAAAAQGSLPLLEALLAAGVSVFEADQDCSTALHCAAARGHAHTCKALMAARADPSTKSMREHSAVDLATSSAHSAVLRVFNPSPSDKDMAEALAALDAAGGHRAIGLQGLLAAVVADNVEAARAALEADCGLIDGAMAAGVTATHLAARFGRMALLRDVLLASSAAAGASTARGCSPLALACEEGHTSTVSLLLAAGVTARVDAHGGVSPLILAVSNGHVEAAQLLLRAGWATDDVDASGYTPLMRAARTGREAMLQLLLDEGAAVNAQVTKRSDELAADQAQTGFSALTFACRFGHAGAAKVLVGAGATIDARTASGFSPLQYCSQFGHHEALSAMIDLRVKACSPSHLSRCSRALGEMPASTVSCNLCPRVQANVNHLGGGGWHALFDACMNGHDEIIRELISAGANVNHARSSTGYTPLMFACQNKHEAAAIAMLTGGADPNQSNWKGEGQTPVQVCVSSDSPACLSAVLAAGGHPAAPGSKGAAPLHTAASNGQAACVQQLLRHGADADVVNTAGRSPLYMAVAAAAKASEDDVAKHVTVAAMLVRAGALVNKADHDGRTPLQLAVRAGMQPILELLRQAGATPEEVETASQSA
jgi:ankyrin repeat protein